jgi:SnoaL-like protein
VSDRVEALVQELLDREAIKELKARYFRCVDARDWDGLRETLADDARFELMGMETIEGGDAFVAFTREVIESREARTVHRGHTPEITIDGPAEAHGRWMLADYIEWPSDPETGQRRGMRGCGLYQETYRKVHGDWRIATWRLDYVRIDPLAPDPLPEQILGAPAALEGAAAD